MYSFPIFSDWHEFSIILDLPELIHCSCVTVIETVVPCREHSILFYSVPFHFIYFMYVGSILRTAGCISQLNKQGRPDHLSFT